MDELSSTAFVISSMIKVTAAFTLMMAVVAYMTLAERRVSAFIQDRLGPNRVGKFGLLQPVADGIKNIVKEETMPATANRRFFLLAPMLAIFPAVVVFAVIPFAAPLPTPWGVVDMIIADIPVGMLYVLAFSSLGVYGMFLAGWASNNKYAFLGGLRSSSQMISYEVALGLSLVPVFMLAGNVTLTEIVWQQQQLGFWYVLPLSLAFIFFVISAFAETNRLPFDLPEAESELVTGYHTEYSSMKFSMFMIAEYAHILTVSALMATLFLGGWSVPFWSGDHMFWYDGVLISGFNAAGEAMAAEPAVWKTLLTFAAFGVKTLFFVGVFIWVRWTLPRFRYDQVMHLGWKVLLPVSIAYVALLGATILLLDQMGVTGFAFGAILTLVSGAATLAFIFFMDRGRVMEGASVASSPRGPRGAIVPDTRGVRELRDPVPAALQVREDKSGSGPTVTH
ncbi:MAG: NADH-quinone oxidoreductase subunit NuoH [Gemmatimonadales bacterium]|nr:MAG: NADH-quinone oxidoreductase subunit NuoH [Gemmatimonadales bacterium]